MKWKEFLIKTSKGAFSGVTAIMGGLFVAGQAMDHTALKMTLGAILSAAFHGAWNATDQYIAGKA